ncbi:MAG: RagB/SusD family nutrient uptake outer membrane protein [Duncaniella sp.]|nr:RagB/SusD family nutrient uptake outer membrane protein [Duncaniella sp.]
MNKIYSLLVAAALVPVLSSCEDWLDLPSQSKADSESVFATLNRAEMTVGGCYSNLHTGELGYQLLMGTDECASKEKNSKYYFANYDYSTTKLSGTYNSMYKAIEYANVCLANLDKVKVSTDAEKVKLDGLKGEALCCRAYAYLNLVRFFGDVPYSDIPTGQLSTFESSRTSRDYIYDRCIEDLQEAVRLLPWFSEGYLAAPDRFTKNSAYGILARTALYAAGYSLRWDLDVVPYPESSLRIARRDDQARVRELFQIAADACKAVIDKGENGLLENYDQVFRNLATQKYDNETMMVYANVGPNAPDVRTGYTNSIPTAGVTNGNLGKSGAQMFTFPTFYFEFEEGDQRRDVSVCNYGIRLAKDGGDTYEMNAFIAQGVGKYRFNWAAGKGPSDARKNMGWPILRYSDVLLMYAEALNELNNGAPALAVSAVKEVRMRAFRNDADKVGEIPTGHDAFLDYIIQERKLELSNEGMRRTDLVRWGIQYEYLMNEKQKLIQLCKREGRYADVDQYRAYKKDIKPQFSDPTIAVPFISITEKDLDRLEITPEQYEGLHVTNSNSVGNGEIVVDLYEANGQVYLNEAEVPEGVKAKAVEYTILNMFSKHTMIDSKGELSVVDIPGRSDANKDWILGNSGVFYGLKKFYTECAPLDEKTIIDVNPGLKGQQQPGY